MRAREPRAATTDDVGGIERLVTDAFEKYVSRIGRPPAPMTADYAELLRTARVWVLEDEDVEDDGDRIIGVLVTKAESDHLEVDSVAVSPTAQHGGHGRRLLRRAEQDARELGLAELRLYTNEAMTENLEYYPRRGYTETGRHVQDGFRRVFFTKRLAPEATSPA